MYLYSLQIEGFRRISNLTVKFQPGLNLLVGPNNAGKSAVIDALRVLLSAGEEGALRVTELDLHVSAKGNALSEATFRYVFRGLSPEEEADFVQALRPIKDGGEDAQYEACIAVRYSNHSPGERLNVKRWSGDHEDNPLTNEMINDLRAVYLQPLRDPAQGLRPGRASQVARLVHGLSSLADQNEVVDVLRELEAKLKSTTSVTQTHAAIAKRHSEMVGEVLSQSLEINLSPSDFRRVAARLGLLVASFEVEQNGLGFNNLIYMAVVLSELSVSRESAYRALLVEEPEAHLHPQLQAVLLNYLKSVESSTEGEKAVQIFLTSHSPHFAALADLDSVTCVYDMAQSACVFSPRDISFNKRKKQKLQRYLNVTRAELFFARRIILVEGAAELFLVEAMAKIAKLDLKKHAVSVISVDGLNFDAFLPLFGPDAFKVRVAALTDSDEDGYPSLGASPVLSDAAKTIAAHSNAWVRVFFSPRTLEYALAQIPENQATMLFALKDINPIIGATLETELKHLPEPSRAEALFKGIFERGEGKTKVQKGAYGQALAQSVLSDGLPMTVPHYVCDAFKFICEG